MKAIVAVVIGLLTISNLWAFFVTDDLDCDCLDLDLEDFERE